jgi:hypothetical protein
MIFRMLILDRVRSQNLHGLVRSLASRRLPATIWMTGQQPVDTHSKLFLDSDQYVCWGSDNSPLVFRKLTLADAKLLSKLFLSEVKSPQLPDPSPKGLHIVHVDFFVTQFAA